MFLAIQPNFKIASKDVQEFFAFMRVELPAPAAGFHAKKMGFHGGLAPGQKLHAHAGSGLEDFSLSKPDEPRVFRGGFKERKYICAVETRDAAESGNGRTHLAAFEGAEKTDRNLRGARHLRERQAAASAQPPEALAGKRRALCWRRNNALALQHVNNGRRI